MTNNLPQSVQDFLRDLKKADLQLGSSIEKVCVTCFMAGQLDEMKQERMRLTFAMNDTIPDNADLSVEKFSSELL